MQFRRILPLVGIVTIALGVFGCDNDPERSSDLGPIEPPDPIPVTRYLNDVARDGASAGYSVDPMPEGDATAPQVSGSQWFVRGG